MIKIKTKKHTPIVAFISSIFIFIICLGQASQCLARVAHNDAVRDSNNHFVRDSNDECVRTKWETACDPCADRIYAAELLEGIYESKIFFDFDKYNLMESEKAKIKKVADIIREHNIDAIKIVGYTDAIGSNEYNHKLSHKRADAVRNYLDTLVTIKHSRVELKGLGKANPIKGCPQSLKGKELKNCLAPNRRAEIEVDYIN